MCTYDHKKVELGFTDESYQLPLHMCYIYKNEWERIQTLAKFIKKGLEVGDKVYYFVDTMSMEDMEKQLISLGVSPEDFRNNNITLSDAKTTYHPDGTFKPDDMLRTVEEVYAEAMEKGESMRNTGEMTWALNDIPGSELLMEYEAKINLLTQRVPINGICQYDARQFDGATIMDVLSVHPYSIVGGQVVKNPFYTPPEEFLKNHVPHAPHR